MVLWVSWTQDLLALRPRCFEGHASSGKLKSWDTRCWVQTLHSWRRGWKSWIPFWLYVTMRREGGVRFMWNCVSGSPTPFSVLVFYCFCFCCCCSIHLMCRGSSANFWISFRGNCSLDSWGFGGSVRRGKFRSLLCCHLEPEPFLCFLFCPCK